MDMHQNLSIYQTNQLSYEKILNHLLQEAAAYKKTANDNTDVFGDLEVLTRMIFALGTKSSLDEYGNVVVPILTRVKLYFNSLQSIFSGDLLSPLTGEDYEWESVSEPEYSSIQS